MGDFQSSWCCVPLLRPGCSLLIIEESAVQKSKNKQTPDPLQTLNNETTPCGCQT